VAASYPPGFGIAHVGRRRPRRLWRCGVTVAVASMLLAGCASSSHTRTPDSARIPVVVDTDMGADDIVSLLYLLGRADLNVVAITVDGDGLVRCPAGVANVRALLRATGGPEVPVACGSTSPMQGAVSFPDSWRDQADGFYGMAGRWPMPASASSTTGDAAALIASSLRAHPGARIVALGPLTTVAQALSIPDVISTNPVVIVSGGAVNGSGNMPTKGRVLPVVEWNIGIDPVAADKVLRSGAIQEWVPLDASNEVPLDSWFVAALAAEPRTHLGDLALTFLQANPSISRGGFYLWDALAAAAVTPTAVMSTQRITMSVLSSGADAGRTIVDSSGATVDVANHADFVEFTRGLLHAFGRATGAGNSYQPGIATIRLAKRDGVVTYRAPAQLPAGQASVSFDASSGTGFAAIIGRLAAGHTLADLQAFIAHGVATAPPWFAIEAQVDVPDGSQPTWLVDLPAGDHVVVCADRDGSGITALGQFVTR